MNGLSRFYKLGVEDADRRVAAALAPVRTEAADRHLMSSRVVMAIDRATRRFQDWWLASESGRRLSNLRDGFTTAPFVERCRIVAFVLLIAVVAHVALMLMQGPRAGWFWMIIPAMVAAFAALLLAGSQTAQSSD
jgi:hypothetical protein